MIYETEWEASDGGRFTVFDVGDGWIRGLEENPGQIAEIEDRGEIPVEVTVFGDKQRQYIGGHPDNPPFALEWRSDRSRLVERLTESRRSWWRRILRR